MYSSASSPKNSPPPYRIEAMIEQLVGTEHLITNLVITLFEKLESSGIRYAVLRNYEDFPNFRRDVDLVLDTKDLEKWREIAVEAAKEGGWDFLTECDHWNQSPIRHFNIEPFRFYRLSSPACLQVDLFHGFLSWGLPLFTEEDLLKDRISGDNKNFTKISPLTENLFRVLQVYQLYLYSSDSRSKIARYTGRIIDFCEHHRESLEDSLQKTFGVIGKHALKSLLVGKKAAFLFYTTLAKSYFVLKYFFRSPIAFFKILFHRVQEHWRLDKTRQCGFILNAYAPGEPDKDRLVETLRSLQEANVLYTWTKADAHIRKTTRRERKIMAITGIVIKWVEKEAARLNVENVESKQLALAIMNLLINNHKIIYQRET